jgi:hypothetical protein
LIPFFSTFLFIYLLLFTCFLFCQYIIDFLQQISKIIAPNVPAVYDVWAGIKGLCAAKTARPNVPE